MLRRSEPFLALWLVCALGFTVLQCGSTGNTAEELAERLTEAMEFDGGEVFGEPPPDGQPGSDAPQISLLEVPESLTLGESFVVTISTDFNASLDVDQAVVSIGDDPDKHIRVRGGLVERGGRQQMSLFGTLEPDGVLKGEAFTVSIALRTRSGVTGEYAVWQLGVTEEETIELDGEPIEEIAVSGEQWVPSGRPEGTADAGAPQIEDIVAPESVTVGEEFTATITSMNASVDSIAAVIITTPNNPGYKITEGFSVRPVTRAGSGVYIDVGVTVTNPVLRGFTLVVVWALQDSGGLTGMYYPLEVNVSGQVTEDGDTEPDGDTQPPSDCPDDCVPSSFPSQCRFSTAGVPLCEISHGCFCMGSPEDEPGRETVLDETLHVVRLTYDFEAMQTEVTQAVWRETASLEDWRTDPSYFSGCGDECPVESVNWFEALEFANALSRREGLPECYTLGSCTGTIGEGCEGSDCPADPWSPGEGEVYSCESVSFVGPCCEGYRLPTEAEWEYAARAGTSSMVYRGDPIEQGCEPVDHVLDPIAWYCGNAAVTYPGCTDILAESGGPQCAGTHQTDMKEANRWGLTDMIGNVYEAVWEMEYDYTPDPVVDPFGPADLYSHIYRGGVWYNAPAHNRSAFRSSRATVARDFGTGFRLVRSLPDTRTYDTASPPSCQDGPCPSGLTCWQQWCIPDFGVNPGQGILPVCDLPALTCEGAAGYCEELVRFDPVYGRGYYDYPEVDETCSNQYRSWIRRDVSMAISYAAARVMCLAGDWEFGNGVGVGLSDMSEEDGSLPGTSIGQPAHPENTHENGIDIDVAYYQVNTHNNRARSICDDKEGDSYANRCTAAPHFLDPWRTALFIGSLLEHPDVRVIGCDGKIGPLVEMALDALCVSGWVTATACQERDRLAYEETDQGMGWFHYRHRTMHISFLFPGE